MTAILSPTKQEEVQEQKGTTALTALRLLYPDLEEVKVGEEQSGYILPRLITFAEFLEMFGEDDDVELIDGVAVKKMATQLEHEKLYTWLDRVVGVYVEERDLGIVIGSRTAIEINNYRSRLPDLLFVRKDRMAIVQEKAIYGAPDLVFELVSPNDRPVLLRALEADYRNLGVEEIIFVDMYKQTVRVLRQEADGKNYNEETLRAGETLILETINSIPLQVDHLLADPRPVSSTIVAALP